MTVSPPTELPDPEASLSVERWAATSGSERSSRANLTLIGGGHRWRANAGGNGAVDALLRAVDSALAPLLGWAWCSSRMTSMRPVPGTRRRLRSPVGVRRRDAPDGPIYPGRAVHENVLQASVEAYVEAIAALLTDEGVDIAASVPSPGDTDRHETDPDHRSGAKDKIMSAYNS